MLNDKLLNYFNGDEMSSNVWLNKYALKSEGGDFLEETPDDMHRRMAKYFAEVEERYEFKEKENESKNNNSRWRTPYSPAGKVP